MTETTPTTELEAVNLIIGTIGEAPVNSVDQFGLEDASLAYSILTAVSREVQLKGWKFNTEYEYPITPNSSGQILVPSNCLQISVAASQEYMWDLAWRQGMLYDRKNHTFTIGQTVLFDMTIQLSFEDMPESARNYITVRAGRKFLDRTQGNADMHGFEQQDESQALVLLEDAEGETEDFNILYGNYDVFRTIDRRNAITRALISK